MRGLRTGAIAVLATFALTGCGGTNSVVVRKNELDGDGTLIANCKNVSSTARVDSYVDYTYATVWYSALLSGGRAGLSDGLSGGANTPGGVIIAQAINSAELSRAASNARLEGTPAADWKEEASTLRTGPEPYCRRLPISPEKAFSVLPSIFEGLGYKTLLADTDLGVYATDFLERNRGFRWRVRYVVHVDPAGVGESVIKVYRTIFVFRGADLYTQEISDGQNEVWILSELASAASR